MSSVCYQFLGGPIGEMLRSASLTTTATIPPPGSLVITTGHIGVDIKTGQLVTSSIEADFNAVVDCLDAVLKNAGVTNGLGSAHKLVAYLTRAEDEATLLTVSGTYFDSDLGRRGWAC